MRFSIITICWNNLPGLKRTYDSLRMQNEKDYEWLVIDGASTDGTKEFLEELDDPYLKYISEPDKGLYDAMNKGIDMAGGDYLVFMNSGDLFHAKDTLQIVSEAIDKHDQPLFIYGDSLDYDHSGNKHYRKARHHKKLYRGMFTQHQSMIFARLPREKQIKYDIRFKLSADYQFIIRYLNLAKKAQNKIVRLYVPLCEFELGGLNETRRFQAMKEDFSIRKSDLKMNFLSNNILYIAHYLHTHFKIRFPNAMKRIRYSKK